MPKPKSTTPKADCSVVTYKQGDDVRMCSLTATGKMQVARGRVVALCGRHQRRLANGRTLAAMDNKKQLWLIGGSEFSPEA